ncbi:MAG: hypothetical protein JWN30_1538 [Bacilli bacterium]|nr:hypothetical protein [Bacilli bacterium]
MQNKLLNYGLMIVVAIAVLGIGGTVLYLYMGNTGTAAAAKVHVPSAQETAASQYTMEKFTANLAGGGIIQVQFTLQADNTKTKSELDIRKEQVRNAINSILLNTSQSDLQKAGGYDKLKQRIVDQVNQLLSSGKVTDALYSSIVVG